MAVLDRVIEADPSHEEAWFYKARGLWIGRADRDGAKRCLIQAMRLIPEKDGHIYQWSANMYRELTGTSADKQTEE